MFFYEKEKNGFVELVLFINQRYNAGDVFDLKFELIYEDITIVATYDTMFETDNGLYDEEGYEEYNAIVFLNLETNELFEVNYLNLPNTIMCGETKVI